MVQVGYLSTGFPRHFGPQLRGQHRLQFNWASLLRAAVRVGRPSWAHVYKHGSYSLHEASYRRYLIRANLKQSASGNILKSDVYQWLDPSEKGGVSYFIGLTMASLLSELVLGFKWLVHLDVYRHLLPQLVFSNPQRPDLISLDGSSTYVVIECKGRTNRPEAGLAAKAKNQTAAVASIGGYAPAARIASIAHFGSGSLSVAWHDPIQRSEQQYDIPVDREQLIGDHYKPMLAFIASSDRVEHVAVNGIDYSVVPFLESDDYFGLATELVRSRNIEERAEFLTERFKSVEDKSESVGLDGTFVRLGEGWAIPQMTLEPGDRSY